MTQEELAKFIRKDQYADLTISESEDDWCMAFAKALLDEFNIIKKMKCPECGTETQPAIVHMHTKECSKGKPKPIRIEDED